MSDINQQIKLIADYCIQAKKKHGTEFTIAINTLLGDIQYLDNEEKENLVKDFKETLEKKKLNEGFRDALKGMTLGAMLATCLVQPAFAKTIANNIQTHHPVTAKYESGDKGYDCIVKDNYGGYSYGKDQISTERRNGNKSTFDYFMDYAKEKDPNIEYHLRKAGGWEAANKGDKAFIDKWCEMTFRKDFQDVYDGFMRDREFLPVYQRMDNATHKTFDKITTWASTNKAVQAAVNSAIIQHGKNGSFKMIKKIIQNQKITTPEQFIKALYNARMTKFPQYKSRYVNELKDIQKYLKSPESKIK